VWPSAGGRGWRTIGAPGGAAMVILLIAWWVAAAVLVAIDLRLRLAREPRGRTSLGIWAFAAVLVAFSVFWFTGARDL
jgi:Na+-transporting NADH:ubiquinone oxidoreductase subunit NqrE